MDSKSAMRPGRPQSVKELVAQANSFKFNTNIPFKHWTRAAETLYQEAYFALSDNDYGRAYMMLYRHSTLVLQFLPSHPQFKEADNRKLFKPLSKRVDSVLNDLEQIKPEIERAYNEWERMTATSHNQYEDRTKAPSSYAEFAARDPTLSGSAKILDASEHQELAVDLAQKELSRRDTVRKASRETDRGERSRISDANELRRQMEAVRQNLSFNRHDISNNDGQFRGAEPPVVSGSYNYPAVSRSKPVDFEPSRQYTPSPPPSAPYRPPKERFPPPIPPREALQIAPDPEVSAGAAPGLPQKIPLDNYQPLVPAKTYLHPEQPSIPAKESVSAPVVPKKERLSFKPGAYLENGDPIRSLFIPTKLRQTFLDIAAENTKAGLEMCGMLCGAPINNALFVRCLLIPQQHCTSDTCETENESGMFDYCMNEDLMILGWIHTHPTQTCFMSSRDLHTHAGYQVMMPESVAIVCAPKYTPSYGIFRLTHPPGLNHILDCRQTETFHPHSIDNLYRETEHPRGHVYESDKMPFYVHDLRAK